MEINQAKEKGPLFEILAHEATVFSGSTGALLPLQRRK
jgi:hypothetical protein